MGAIWMTEDSIGLNNVDCAEDVTVGIINCRNERFGGVVGEEVVCSAMADDLEAPVTCDDSPSRIDFS